MIFLALVLSAWLVASPDRTATGLRGGLTGAGRAGWRHVRSEVRAARTRSVVRRQTARVARWTRWRARGLAGRGAVWAEQQARGLVRAVVWSARTVWSARGPVRSGWRTGLSQGRIGLVEVVREAAVRRAVRRAGRSGGLHVLTPDQAADPVVWSGIDPMSPDARARLTGRWAPPGPVGVRPVTETSSVGPDAGQEGPEKAEKGRKMKIKASEYNSVADLIADAKAIEAEATALDQSTWELQARVWAAGEGLTAAPWDGKQIQAATDQMVGSICVTQRPWQDLADAARGVVRAGEAAQADVGQAAETHGARGDAAAFTGQ